MDELLQIRVVITITITIFLIFIYTLFFFNWSKNIKFWPKQKSIHSILHNCITKSKKINVNKLENSYNKIKELFKDKEGEIHLDKMHKLLSIMSNQKDKGDKYLIIELLNKMQVEQKYFSVSKNFQILLNNIDSCLELESVDKQQLKMNITLLYNKIGEIEREVRSSNQGYWVGLIGIVVSVVSFVFSFVQ